MNRLPAACAAALFLAACSSSNEQGTNVTTPAAVDTSAAPVPAANIVEGRVPAAQNGMVSVVVLEPRAPREFGGQPQKPVMDQVGLTFTPAVMLVRTGQPAEFRNNDDVLHNVRVFEMESKQGAFNVAIPTGGAYEHTFERDGFYDVGCDIHPGMSAIVVSTSTPFTVMADASGNFSIADVPPGSYKVTVYAGAQTLRQDVEVSAGRTAINIG